MKRLGELLLVVSIFSSGSGAICYECTSLDATWCGEYFDDDDVTLYHNSIVNCSGTFCMKLIGHSQGNEDFYVRTCDVTNGRHGTCVTGSHVLGIPTSTVCVCQGDRCNTGAMLGTFSFVFYCLSFQSILVRARTIL